MRETATKEVMGENILHEKWWERLRETTTNCWVHHITREREGETEGDNDNERERETNCGVHYITTQEGEGGRWGVRETATTEGCTKWNMILHEKEIKEKGTN